jgi:hypothetical protein
VPSSRTSRARWLNGEAIDLSAYLSTVGVQRRVLISLGLQRQGPKDITPSLGSYLADREEPDDGGEGVMSNGLPPNRQLRRVRMRITPEHRKQTLAGLAEAWRRAQREASP